MNPYATTLLIAALLAGCSGPMRQIVVRNEAGGEASVSWYIKEDSINSSPVFLSNSRETTIPITARGGHELRISAGEGVWNPASVKNFADDFDSMVLRWNGRSILLASAEEITDYLMARRRGAGYSRIRIRLNRDDSTRSLPVTARGSN